ncbi:TetR/AcrR family transcriptional regulator [Paenibacillus lactis]|uniref:TetR/AcrR family transcriptional regulator n=1 Tax=Paenibacillus lactis TaxID=228574 RepID=UPI001B217249|nr:TetR/AcrR family transcriptional regulator [Paenibacillus lactis]GIO93848.1 TetR family transcriptional regulator [Paenibacillus lactis]
MSKQKERFETMRAEATEKILLSAAKLFATKTFGKTTMQDIADDAGLSKGLAYRYFATKEEIMSRLIEISIPGFDRMAGLFEQEGNEKDVIIEATTFLLSNLQEDPSSTDGLLLISQIDSFTDQELSPDLKNAVRASMNRLIDSLSELIQAGQGQSVFKPGDPRRLALFYYSTFQGVAFTSRSFHANYLFPTTEMFLDFLIQQR